jgi:uridylate kinase
MKPKAAKTKMKKTSVRKYKETVVISLGGSIIVPKEVDIAFLKSFKAFVERHIKKGYRFIIVSGGGHTCRMYQNAASSVELTDTEDLDWLGIHATRLNGHLLRTIFRKSANEVVLKSPRRHINFTEPVLIAAGWKPGFSTDYDTVLLAKRFGAKTVINLTNTDFVYTKDPRHNGDARPIKALSWKEFRRLVGDRWEPGMNVPFDPLASAKAEKLGLKVAMLKGTDIKNLEDFLAGRKFKGTLIS